MLTHRRLKQVLHYDPQSGLFTWRERRWGAATRHGAKRGQTGSVANGKYLMIRIDCRLYLAHRLAWFYIYKKWPSQIDHADMDGFNNRINNLRLADDCENGSHKGRRSDNTTGYKGVTRAWGKFQAQIKSRGKHYYLGLHKTAEEAHAAYCAKAKELHGKFFHP